MIGLPRKKKEKDKKRKRDDDSDAEHGAPLSSKRLKQLPYFVCRLSKITQGVSASTSCAEGARTQVIKAQQCRPLKSEPSFILALSLVDKLPQPVATDWSLAASQSLLPQRPVSIPSLPALPRKPIEVKEDFSKAKAPASQVPIMTFYASAEPWIRNIREEDVGWLEYDGDIVGPYVMPELGRHYTEQWEDEEIAFYGGVPASLDFTSSRNSNAASSSSHAFAPQTPLPKWDAATLGDGDLASERGMGPVSERVVAALLPAANPATWKSVKEAEDAYESKASSNGAGSSSVNGTSPAPPSREKILVADFEERLKDTMRFHGLLQGEVSRSPCPSTALLTFYTHKKPKFNEVIDDPISTALRQAQRQLRAVTAENKCRRARLTEAARDRLAYQEYVDTREALDKNIASAYAKLQKKEGPKASKKKKKGGDVRGEREREREREASAGLNGVNGMVNGIGGGGGPGGAGVNAGPVVVPLPNPASLGLGPDEDNTLTVPETLKGLVETRRQWVDVIGGSFEEMERETSGRVRGVPARSVFEGVEEEVRGILGASGVFVPPAKGDGGSTSGEKG